MRASASAWLVCVGLAVLFAIASADGGTVRVWFDVDKIDGKEGNKGCFVMEVNSAEMCCCGLELPAGLSRATERAEHSANAYGVRCPVLTERMVPPELSLTLWHSLGSLVIRRCLRRSASIDAGSGVLHCSGADVMHVGGADDHGGAVEDEDDQGRPCDSGLP
eukprot:1783318-Rhodomonas_salina.2